MRTAMLCLMSGSLAVVSPVLSSTPVPAGPLPSLWQEQHISFTYVGRGVRYSCDGLRDKVRAMLLDLGVRRDIRITANGCVDDGGIPARSIGPSLSIVFFTLTSGTAQTATAPTVEARFQSFAISSDAFRNMGVGDCELVEEFARQILPKLTTRYVKQDLRCVPYQESGNRFLIQGEVLKVSTVNPSQRAP